MHEKINEIFSCLLDINPESYKKIEPEDGYVELITNLTELMDHRTFIKYEITSDNEMVRFEINYMFGSISQNRELSVYDILELLRLNHGTFMLTSCFLSAKEVNGFDYIFLRSCLPFLLKWPSEEIAEMVNSVLHDIVIGLGTGPWTKLNAINPFQPKE